ncbi:patatin-like phospholipase family protein [uncultured Cytophaga sp.]|uniref:patatin-like phospholipase family protein n=1 Tax=uncultured Cytophaga sp. TaxID=160238 RepID=UPI0026154A92|nr:patatin-like phospholipase family protein [uncultured Cytophaga sp.]
MNLPKNPSGDWIQKVYYSFAVQLVLNNIKKNQILLLIWLILLGCVTRTFGDLIGIPYLFLDPEYLYVTNFKSFFIIGIALGIFITSFHITIYILDSYKFPFLGATPKPFSTFCLNNSIIPILFTGVYVINIIYFQNNYNIKTIWEVFCQVAGLLTGQLTTILIMFLYFSRTNKDIFKELAQSVDKTLKRNPINRVNVLKDFHSKKLKNKYHITSFFTMGLKVAKTPDHDHLDRSMMMMIFDQNHLNAVIVEICLITVIISLGLFRDNPLFQIPAAASGILFFSIIVMFTGAFSYWLRGWAITSIVIILVVLNFLIKEEFIQSTYQVFGINYNKKSAVFSLERLKALSNAQTYKADKKQTLKILDNWRSQFPDSIKPKMIFICTSGGGQRAAVWTLRTLQYTDSVTNGALMKQTRLITGASGGIIGASYFRELKLMESEGKIKSANNFKYLNNISKDVLNPVVFSMVVNDLFFRFQKFTDGNHEYYKDRGYAFEQKMHENTEYVMYKRISDYKKPEEDAKIPMLMLSPTIINDGRKLYISPINVAYMTTKGVGSTDSIFSEKIKGVEFKKFFESQEANDLHFMSALRMSATFPYITPNVDLPSEPAMEIMDAGLSDNFGVKDATTFLYVFKEWISMNTSGVIFVNIRDSQKNQEIEKGNTGSVFQNIVSPIGSLYNNWSEYQDFNNDNLLEYASSWLNAPLDVVEFEYIPRSNTFLSNEEKKSNKKPFSERAALSWHLTLREKESLYSTIFEPNNQKSIKRLQFLLSQ